MRTEAEVQDRIRYLLTLEIDRKIVEASARLPYMCQHNHRHALDVRKKTAGTFNEQYNKIASKNQSEIGLCMLGAKDPTSWPGNICEDPIDAKRCPYFTSTSSSEAVKEEFYRRIRDLDWVRVNLPEVYGLLWALGSVSVPALPWWKVVLLKFLQIRPEPLARGVTSLPPGE